MSLHLPCKAVIAQCALALAAQLLPTPALSQDRLQLAQYRECSERVGPFVTQTTAWDRWRYAQGSGYAVSNGVAPCYEGSTRGYCFFVFYRC